MMRFPPIPRPASDAATPVRARRIAGYFSSTAIATLVMLGATSIAGAQNWTGAAGDNDYGNAGNWDPAVVPVAGDDVLIDENIDVNVNAAFDAGTLQQDTAIMTVGMGGDLSIAGEALFRFGSALQIDDGGTLSAGSMTVRNAATVNIDGTLAAPTEVLGTGSLNVNAGGTLDGDLLMAGVTPSVTIAQDGTLTGIATVNRGTLIHDGTILGDLDTTGGNATVDVTIGATGSVGGAVTHGAGVLSNAGTLSGGLSVGNGTTATITDTGSVTGGATVTLGTLNIDSVNASVDTLILNAGTVNSIGTVGDATVNGGVFNNDNVTGGIIQTDGTVNNTNTVNGPVDVSGGTFNSDDDINGDVTLSGGAFNAAGTISGDIDTTGGTFTTTGALSHTGDFTNAGRVDVAGGDLDTSGSFTNDGDLTLSGADLVVGGAFTNTDRVILDDGRAFSAASVANSGFIGLGAGTPGAITATIDAPVTGTAGSRLDLQNAAAGDSMVISGGLSGVNTLALDIDLTTSNAGFADILSVNGAVDGDLAITLNPITNNGAFTLQTTPITLVDGDTLGGALNTSFSGPLTAGGGLVLYRLAEDAGNGDITLQSDINPAIGGVAGAFSSVQSLVSTVVNRPSGAYVSGIAFDAPNNCSTGTWARATGGRVEADTTSTNRALGDRVTSRGSLNYGGFQGGADFGCFEAFDGGWDISGGVLAGYNQGTFKERARGLLTTGDFDQYFVGGYVAAAKGNWSGELQLRYANADFTFDNAALDLRDASDDVDSYSLSGSMTYRFDLREGLALLPTVGFAVTDNDSALLTFRNESGAALGRLKVEDHTTKTTFLGATLSQTRIDEAAATATNAFITGTYYFDNSGSRKSTFTSADGSATAEAVVTTSEIGDFGEISVGGSYVQVLGTAPGQVQQVNYGVRVDARFGDDVEGVGITGQIRLQF